MKIIFDSEEQKAEFEYMMGGCCPSILGLKGDCDHNIYKTECDTCWKRCGLEMEIRGE